MPGTRDGIILSVGGDRLFLDNKAVLSLATDPQWEAVSVPEPNGTQAEPRTIFVCYRSQSSGGKPSSSITDDSERSKPLAAVLRGSFSSGARPHVPQFT